ncbi:SCO family protein [Bacillus massilinigeriensis]|uniref:SCO family protein n=1 Tax=Bacillus massilionigeriensis TaxID=1805475 RepID=UPI00096ADFE2|nr:SCO family protein [Bacillus massilionigeriensis]
MKIRILASILIVMAMLLSACGQKEIKDKRDWPIKDDFSYTDQDGNPFGLQDLKGKVWVADFIFTTCIDVCLPMTSNMAKLQQMVKDENIKNIEFVSFSVDPEVDKPEKLKEFGESFSVNFKNWHFLTGYSQESIEKFAMENFKAMVKKPENEDQVIHGTDFYLVDQNGTIVKYYTGLNKIPFKIILNDIEALQ